MGVDSCSFENNLGLHERLSIVHKHGKPSCEWGCIGGAKGPSCESYVKKWFWFNPPRSFIFILLV